MDSNIEGQGGRKGTKLRERRRKKRKRKSGTLTFSRTVLLEGGYSVSASQLRQETAYRLIGRR